MKGEWELARRISIFIIWEVKEVHSQKVLDDALCNFRLTLSKIDLYRKMHHSCVCVLWILLIFSLLPIKIVVLIAVVLEIVTYLRDNPKSHFKEDCTILFHTNKSVKILFWSMSFLKNTCLWRTLRRNSSSLIKMSLIFTRKI